MDVAKSIGADVPFCLFNTPSRSEGIGEKLTPIEVNKEYYVLLIKPKRGLSTKEVYVKYDEVGSSSNPNVDKSNVPIPLEFNCISAAIVSFTYKIKYCVNDPFF